MEIRAEQLAQHLEREKLRPIYLVWGAEPLQSLEAADCIRRFARQQGYAERKVLDLTEAQFRWSLLGLEAGKRSLFSHRKLIELRLGERSPGREGGEALKKYAASPAPDNVLLISTGRLESSSRKTRWYQALERAGVVIPAWPIKVQMLPGWLQKRAQSQGLQLDLEAARAIAERTEGNLLAARQELDRLALLGETQIEAERVLAEMADNARFNVFDLIEASLSANLNRACRMLLGLRQEGVEPFAVFGALLWELRRIYMLLQESGGGPVGAQLLTRHGIRGPRQRAMQALLQRCDQQRCCQWLGAALRCDRLLKSSDREEGWRELIWLFLKLGGREMEIPGIRLETKT